MCTVWELTIDFQLITGNDFGARALFKYPIDLHVEGVSPGYVVDGQCDCRTKGSREAAVTEMTWLRDTLSNNVFASFPNH